MQDAKSLLNSLTDTNELNFEAHALAIFRWQAVNNSVYKQYLQHLGTDISSINTLEEIPFLPISFFKTQPVKSNEWVAQKVFESSGTTGLTTSKHHLKELDFYHVHAQQLFEDTFGNLDDLHILALLPSYLERNNSSLVSMVQFFIDKSGSENSGFYLHNLQELAEALVQLKESNRKVILFGVTFALLDLAEQFNLDLSHITVIETGGMKGRREEVTREELYDILRRKLNLKNIYSEYGMTELLSQAYGKNAIFSAPKSLQVLIREVSDPFAFTPTGKTGGVNIIDLANVNTCSFIETQDLGRLNSNGSFEILGRFDNSDLRGCNLLVS